VNNDATPGNFCQCLIRRSVRYLLVSPAFDFSRRRHPCSVEFVLTGSRIAFIDNKQPSGHRRFDLRYCRYHCATDHAKRRVTTAIDRRFFREAYNAELILTELGEAIPTLSKPTTGRISSDQDQRRTPPGEFNYLSG